MFGIRDNSDPTLTVVDAEARDIAANPKIRARHIDMRSNLPGGGARSVVGYHPLPVAMAGEAAAELRDVDDHSDPTIQARLIEVTRVGVAARRAGYARGCAGKGTCPPPPRTRSRALHQFRDLPSIMAISTERWVTGRAKAGTMCEGY
ncbi:hypothetical protein [Paracoccus aminophilus]|uniref:hypothetical protein n=1 Tax=Paracoccus aminophilus TaxID=34003 RepID=UPI0005A2177F|nr:hypothetical protein [Paracoccus aminophilus]